mmetsp:Transcript_3565/g.12985  ORF Transcript_3565/g.12985 Transcript_3565/m.12985 type:complete len:192 (-) Transcript_3565:44-619(-)
MSRSGAVVALVVALAVTASARAVAAAAAGDAAGRFTCGAAGVEKALRYNVSGRLAADYLPAGAEPGESLATAVCCDIEYMQFAEPAGFFQRPDVALFAQLNADATTTFYDSACGIPLFVAPRNRTFAAWRAESAANGWPSFRQAEVVEGNVIALNGLVASKCGTHLGSLFRDQDGNRYCTDLSCVSGNPRR